MGTKLRFIWLACFLFAAGVANAQLLGKEEILINNGSKYTNSYKVELRFKIEDDSVDAMLVSNVPDFAGAHWVDYHREILDWSLEFKDGLQEVYAKFRYDDGSESELFTDEIIVDTTPPENPYVKIELPSKYTNDKSLLVDLSLSAVDAKYVMVSNQHSFYGQKWRLFEDNQIPDWRLADGDDGPRQVFVRFRDKAGNESEIVSDEIIIDTKAPFDIHVQVNEGKKYLVDQAKQLKIDLFARAADSMAIAVNDTEFANPIWEPYTTLREITLEGEDGTYAISTKFKDFAGNESDVYTEEVILDTTPPQNCEVLINNGAESTNQLDKLVTIYLKAADAAYFKITNDPISFNNVRWKAYVGMLQNWKLDGEEDGLRTVYVKFKDEAGNISKTYQATIMLERGF